MKILPIGISDYKTIIDNNHYYVDKTLLIKEINELAGVLLITRPRRFGKTLNLSMLKYFFEKTESKNDYLFHNKKIWEQAEYHKKQGTYPVIFISFKNAKGDSWESAYADCISIISNEFSRHQYLLDVLKPRDTKFFEKIFEKTGSYADFTESLLYLTELLHNYHKQKVIVLIDEYDAPIDSAYINGYYKNAIGFMKSLLTKALKDNVYLEKGVLTGVVRTAKESIFSELNNVRVYSLWKNRFSDKFGFTENEVDQLLLDQEMSPIKDGIKSWYNGYTFGTTTIYNPWSILMCLAECGVLEAYWVNTGGNALIKKLIAIADESLKIEIETVLSGLSITKEVSEVFVYPGIENDPEALWSLLLAAGYITYSKHEVSTKSAHICELVIPNKEIRIVYEILIKEIIEQSLTFRNITVFFNSLITGDIKLFSEMFQEFIINNMSTFDFSQDHPEKSYQLFILGMLTILSDKYEIRSERESGLGRYDIMLIPINKSQLGIVMEFKKISIAEEKSLEDTAEKALEQIKNKKYWQELKAQDIKNIVALGIAFKGKKICIKSDTIRF